MRIVQERFAVVWQVSCWCLLVGWLSGCGGSTAGPARATVAGRVTFKGEPVAQGQIRFTPDQGPFAQAEIRNGKYQVDYKGGVPVGSARVEIDSYAPIGPEIVEQDGTRSKQLLQVLPKKFNTASTLRAEITTKPQGDLNFDLVE